MNSKECWDKDGILFYATFSNENESEHESFYSIFFDDREYMSYEHSKNTTEQTRSWFVQFGLTDLLIKLFDLNINS